MVPYLDTLRWLLISVALIGIAFTIHARIDDWKRGRRGSRPCSAGSPPARGSGGRCAARPEAQACGGTGG
jgi:hypothetical protein